MLTLRQQHNQAVATADLKLEYISGAGCRPLLLPIEDSTIEELTRIRATSAASSVSGEPANSASTAANHTTAKRSRAADYNHSDSQIFERRRRRVESDALQQVGTGHPPGVQQSSDGLSESAAACASDAPT